jgi:hypothetical protein
MLGSNSQEKICMRSVLSKFVVVAASLVLGTSLLLAAKAESFTGEVGDAMCGAKHEMGGSPADCTRECIKQGSKYVLIVGDKVYTLETKDKATLDTLDKLAGLQAKVTGSANGTVIEVGSVAAAAK